MDIELALTNISTENKRIKMSKAIRALSERLGVPVSIGSRKKGHIHGPEPFIFRAQEELNYKWYNIFSVILKDTYNFVIKYMGLPEITIISKAGPGDDKPLTHRGKIIYNPQTGDPIKKSDWEAFVKTLEKFLNRNLKDTDKKIILESKALGRILDRMLKYNRYEEVTNLPLKDVKYRGKTLDWISENINNMRTVMGEALSRTEMARIQVMEMSAGQKITAISEKVKADVKKVLIDGVLSRKSKSQISQDLFHKMTGHNRDFQMIADTEIQNAVNNAMLLDEVHNSEPGEKVYFKRIEVIDQNTCKFCRKMNGVVALWSDTPLTDDEIKDPIADFAIWDGKNWNGQKEFVADGVFHPYCYSSDTEVMTHRGWKLFKDLLDDDKIMSINPKNQEIDFVSFLNRVSYQYSGKMIYFLGRNYDLLVTPNHNMLYARQKRKIYNFHEATAKEMLNKKGYLLPRGIGKWEKSDVDKIKYGDLIISKSQYLRLWAWYLAEGSGRAKTKTSSECKLAQKYPQKIAEDLPDIAQILKINHEAVYIYGKYADPFKEMFDKNAESKYIPDFIKESSADNIREFLDAFSLADGSKFVAKRAHKKSYSEERNEIVLRTSSVNMANDLCELIVKAGWMPSVYKLEQKGKLHHFSNGDYIQNTDCYNITICKSKFRTFGCDSLPYHKTRHEPFEVDYHGMVYDVELEKWHFLLVRRNGKCAWSGNCRGRWMRYNKTVDALIAHLQNKSELFNKALEKARAEWREKGVENPNDRTPGFVHRVNELFKELYGEEDIVEKSLTWSGYELQDRYKFADFDISVENKAGSVRSGKDKDGHNWHCKMHYDYGYIRGSVGVDGDQVDVYIGQDEDASYVYVVHQNDPVTGKYDEDKVMMGFPSMKDARQAYLKQYDRPGFLGDIDAIPIEEFREKVLAKKNHGKMIKSFSDRVQEALGRKL